MKKYFHLFYTKYICNFAYPTEIYANLIYSLVTVMTAYVYWGNGQSPSQHSVLTYIVYMPFVSVFLNVGFCTMFVSEWVRTGELSNYLVKPVSLPKYILTLTLAGKVSNFLQTIVPTIMIVAVLVVGTQVQMPDLTNIGIFALLVPLVFMLSFMLDLALSYVAFWLTDVWSLGHFKNFMLGFLGGSILPLDIYPPWIQHIAQYLPFQYIFYVPIRVLMGKPIQNMTYTIGILCAWIIVLYVIMQLLYAKGKRRYEAYGH